MTFEQQTDLHIITEEIQTNRTCTEGAVSETTNLQDRKHYNPPLQNSTDIFCIESYLLIDKTIH